MNRINKLIETVRQVVVTVPAQSRSRWYHARKVAWSRMLDALASLVEGNGPLMVWVVQCNDYAHCVFSTEAKAKEFVDKTKEIRHGILRDRGIDPRFIGIPLGYLQIYEMPLDAFEPNQGMCALPWS